MSEASINAALITAARAAFALTTPAITAVAYEGRDFTPPSAGTTWAAVFVLPAGSPPASLGVGGQDEHVGILQIDINEPRNSGIAAQLGKTDTIAGYFKAGTRFTYSGQVVIVRSCSRGRLRDEDGWLRQSISIAWTAMTTR